MMSPSRAEVLPALTGARFFAAFAVVIVHYGTEFVSAFFPALAATAAAGPVAVSLFYVLSGAVLTWGSTASDGAPLRPSRIFWAQRIARIAPAYWLALSLCLVPFLLQLFELHSGASAVARALLTIVAGVLALHAFIPQLSMGLNTPGWSISCEAFFYATWPRLVLLLWSEQAGFPWRRTAALWIAALFPTVFGVSALYLDAVPEGPFATSLEAVSGQEMLRRTFTYFPPLRLAEFAMGIVLGHALRRTAELESRQGPSGPEAPARSVLTDTLKEVGLLAAICGAATLLGAGLLERLTGVALATNMSIESGVLSPLFALLVWQLARGRGAVQRFLSRAPLLALGEASYGLYILQEPVFVWFSAASKRVFPVTAAGWELGFLVYSVLLVGLSLVVHRFIELPVRGALLARWTPRTQKTQPA